MMKESFFTEHVCSENCVIQAEIYVPDYYTRGMGLKGLWILGDIDSEIQQLWMDIAWKEEMILFLLCKKTGRWEKEDTPFLLEYIQDLSDWKLGGFGILSAYRYLVGTVDAKPVIEKITMVQEMKNSFAQIKCYANKEIPFAAMWEDIKKFRRIIFNNTSGSTVFVRNMNHLKKKQIKIEGIWRSWYSYIPQKKKKKYPLVLAFHGITSNGEKFLEQTEWDMLGEKYGFAVVAPTGYLNRWNISDAESYPSDILFVKHILKWAEEECNVDVKRIYLMGFSMGAAMVNLLQCRLPFVFATSVAFSGQLAGQDEDAVVLLKGDNRKENVYNMEQKGIPRNMWIAYGEEEKKCDYPGKREDAIEFWLEEAGADKTKKYCLVDDEMISETVYPGIWSDLHIIMQKKTGHAYHPQLMEYIYLNFFSKVVRYNKNNREEMPYECEK